LVGEQSHTFLKGRVVVLTGDITRQTVDAIVNAANSSLLGGGGVDGAIHRAAGPSLLAECRELRRVQYPGGLPTGQAVITKAGNLPARYIIHTVGPVYGEHQGHEAELLAAAYTNSLELAARQSLASIAFPAISTGVYGYPRAEAAPIVSQAIRQFSLSDTTVKEVRLVFFQEDDLEIFLNYQQFR
jgi:O-acetyl-ADP-ribose deacetylase